MDDIYKLMKDKDFYKIQEFADKIGVCYRTVYNGIKAGHIEAFKVGKGKGAHYRIAHTEIQRLGIFSLDEIIDRIIEKKLLEREEKKISEIC
jgi:excisionase family DNA binding protein